MALFKFIGKLTIGAWKWFWLVLGLTIYALAGVWCALAIRFSNLPGGETFRILCAVVFTFTVLFFFVFRKIDWKTWLGAGGAYVLVIVWWNLIPASNDRDWRPEYARMPHVEFNGDMATIYNVRDFDYRSPTDFSSNYVDKTYNLDKIERVDFIVSYWDGNTDVAHTMLSFGFSNGEHVVVSVETRMEQGEPQSGLRGLFKQYELIYIFATESDILRLRTNFRKEDLYVYETNSSPEEARRIFFAIAERVNELDEKPEFYNTITDNCTTSLAREVRKGRPPKKFDIRLFFNGLSDEMTYENGWLKRQGTFKQTKRKAHVNSHVDDDDSKDTYSARLRTEKSPLF